MFVAHMICVAGYNVPRNSYWFSVYPPVANDWAGDSAIENWVRIGDNENIQPGFVVGHPAAVGSGHCDIVDFDGEGIAAGRYIVNRDYEDWLDGTSGFRRYKDE